ncbi:hypothetical protein B0H13DRAFT_2263956 [Mycena leptocephala]|nr:hypothetical protein B0H13DRAFT_2263956 [Mycena leptocephala]
MSRPPMTSGKPRAEMPLRTERAPPVCALADGLAVVTTEGAAETTETECTADAETEKDGKVAVSDAVEMEADLDSEALKMKCVPLEKHEGTDAEAEDPLCTALALWLPLTALWEPETEAGFMLIDSVQSQMWLDVVAGLAVAVVTSAGGGAMANSGLDPRTSLVSDMLIRPMEYPLLYNMRREVARPDIYMGFRVKGWQSVPFDEIRERDQRLVVHRDSTHEVGGSLAPNSDRYGFPVSKSRRDLDVRDGCCGPGKRKDGGAVLYSYYNSLRASQVGTTHQNFIAESRLYRGDFGGAGCERRWTEVVVEREEGAKRVPLVSWHHFTYFGPGNRRTGKLARRIQSSSLGRSTLCKVKAGGRKGN